MNKGLDNSYDFVFCTSHVIMIWKTEDYHVLSKYILKLNDLCNKNIDTGKVASSIAHW